MFQGVLIFALAGLVLVVAYLAIVRRRRAFEATEAPEDRLTDEEFRRIEFGDDV